MPEASQVLPGTISAVAAGVAAVLAGFNLYFTGRREGVKWRRDALADTFVDFLTASYDHKNVSMLLMGAKASRWWHSTRRHSRAEGISDLREDERAYDHVMMSCLSRLRVLTTDEAVDAAQRLHYVNHRYLEQAKDAHLRHFDVELTRGFDDARDRLVECAKRVLGIKESQARVLGLRGRGRAGWSIG